MLSAKHLHDSILRGRSFMTSATLGQPNSDICGQGGEGGQSKSDILLPPPVPEEADTKLYFR